METKAPCSREFLLGLFSWPSRVEGFWAIWALLLVVSVVTGLALRSFAERREERGRGSWLLLAAASLPLAWCLAFGLEILLARMSIGTWPYARRGSVFDGSFESSPLDPKRLGPLNLAIWIGWPIAALGLYWFPLVASGVAVARRRIPWEACTLFATGFGLLSWIWYADPGGFLEWWFD